MTGSGDGGAAVRFTGVRRVHRGGTVALDGVDLAVPHGSIFGVIGHSGAGKSTLIRMVNALDRPTTGTVEVDGVDLHSLSGDELRAAQKRTGMVFQQFNLLETVSVRDNVAMPLRLDGVRAADARRRAADALEFVGLGSMADRRPRELSGGQRQRVGIARAIVRNPRVLLCDEATSALDPTTTAQVLQLIARINEEYGTTVLVVTHEMDVIKDLCHEVAVMESGRIIEQGSVLDVFVRPRTETARTFVGTVIPHEIPSRVRERLGGAALLHLLLIDEQVTAPLVSGLIHRFGVQVNILHADMTDIQGHTVGQMVVQIDGDAAAVAAARAALGDQVTAIEEVAA